MARRTPEEAALAKRQAAAAKGAKTRQSNAKIAGAASVREAHEQAHPERYVDAQQHYGTSMSPRQIYRSMNFGVNDESDSHLEAHVPVRTEHPTSATSAPSHPTSTGVSVQGELFDHPGRVQQPSRWENLPRQKQDNVIRRAAEFGVTPNSAHHALASQVDQAFITEGTHQNFYTARGNDENGDMRPAERIITSAKENKVAPHLQAAANAVTSPKQKFATTPKTGVYQGQRVYPNDMMATNAVQHGLAGTPEEAHTPPGIGGMHGNARRAAHVVDKVVNQGVPLKEAYKAGPKTGAYHNSWVDPNGPEQFFTSDIHSGGGGLAPHLSMPDREKYLNIPNIHEFNDHVARRVMHDRGLRSMSGTQSAQWSEERRQRGLQGPHDTSGPATPPDPHQGRLF